MIIGGTGNKFKDASSVNGAVRGFDAVTGEFLWSFDTLIRDPESSESFLIRLVAPTFGQLCL
ncbi:MAG: hypothetical protein Ct9H300mP6_06290 [Gammaproteobacteria bacterium]|nr:MAG: hypothetical protein Ct9H300mP6_06290 [Gammaproteobacteria bacterium]